MKKILALVLCIALIGCLFVSCGGSGNTNNENTPEPTEEPVAAKLYGLHIEEDGTITLGGEPYYAFGTNWHGGFARLLDDQDLDYDPYFEALSQGLPVIRTMMNVFYTQDEWKVLYDDEALFDAMDRYVAYCEKYHIGLIMSMMWCTGNFYEIAGEKMADCLGDPNAKGTQIMLNYVEKIVKRYKDSPAIFAWEVGNEGCLAADRGDGTSIQYGNYYRLFAEKVREIDPYRMITTGDSMIFECTHALRTTGKWEPNDTPEQRVETLEIYNPDPIDTVCVHFYGHDTYQRIGLVPTDMEIAKNMKKGFIVGEYGAGYSEWDSLNEAEMEVNWCGIVDELVADNVQIALQWDFGRCAELNDEWSIELGFTKGIYQNEYQYNKLKEVNEKLVADGKNKSAEYWANAEPLIYGNEENTLDGKILNHSTDANDLLKDVSVLSKSCWDGASKSLTGVAYTNKATVTTTLADGNEGLAMRIKTSGDAGSTATFPNRFIVGKLVDMKEGQKFTAKITCKAMYGEGKSALENGSKLVIAASKNDEMEINADGEWHTYTYDFEVVGTAKPTITVGSTSVKAGAVVGSEIIVSDFELYAR